MRKITEEIRERLFALQDLKYREFNLGIVPGTDGKTVIGVRTPALKELAKEYAKNPEIGEFLSDLPHYYFEENNLHAFIIALIKDYDTCLGEVERFLPYVDNWATCDQLRPKVFKKHTKELLPIIKKWMASSETYTIRFGIGMIMCFYLDDEFDSENLEIISKIRSEEYYVNMMLAWFFATALAKQWEATIPYIEEKKLAVWVHNKTIQKSRESFRITAEQKEYLKELKIK